MIGLKFASMFFIKLMLLLIKREYVSTPESSKEAIEWALSQVK